METARLESQNVAGILTGTDPKLRDEYVVLSAHLDHLGAGAPIAGDAIYNGAMDNASGIASLIEISQLIRQARPRRSVLFVAVTGEEKGLAGSRYFTAHPPVPIERIVADLNMDMFLPLFPLRILMAQGLEESDLGDRLREIAQPLGVEIQADPEPERNRFIRSDQYSFIRRGIPALAFKFGYVKGSPEEATHKEWTRTRYHAPSDDLDQPVDRAAAAQFNRLLAALAARVANADARPRWKPTSFFRRFASQENP
jgi:Zn-dependent M28 family amino/carboxypeptidase